ncbi:binding protein [[Candida] boidinii]|nr:binding protein [[Candida] boidinii]OWB74661.1 binding protein [[Candida] boidinii]
MSLKRSRDDSSDDTVSVLNTNNAQLKNSIKCTLTPKCIKENIILSSQDQFEIHYLTNHSNICSICHKRFPNERILELHIDENHNPFNDLRILKGDTKIYKCFIKNCDKICSSHKKRRLHLIDKHNYPKNYLFSIVDKGIEYNNLNLLKNSS